MKPSDNEPTARKGWRWNREGMAHLPASRRGKVKGWWQGQKIRTSVSAVNRKGLRMLLVPMQRGMERPPISIMGKVAAGVEGGPKPSCHSYGTG